MKRLKFCGNGVLQIEQVPEPVPREGEVLIRTTCSAICGSEMHVYRHGGMVDGNPGHEAVGTVAAVGAGVKHLVPGQRVGVSPIAGCGCCPACREGKYTWCPNWRFYGNMHAELFLAAANACRPLPDDLDWESGVLLTGDGFGVPFHSAQNVRIDRVENVAIFGAGPIGLGNVIMQNYLKRRVFVVDLSAERLALAHRLGADEGFQPQQCDVIAELKQRTGGNGVDLCIEAAGQPSTVKSCFAAVRRGGQVLLNGEQGEVPLSISEDFIRRDVTATGSWFYHFCEFDAMYELWKSGLAVNSLISHHFSFDDAPEAYRLFAAGKTAKVILFYQQVEKLC
ncbi:alcohol dehydrogenase catalytic domain-containing protein [bacterium]|nr:alcohol dehydrogenase catalytic domain-containing protein [bacterium]